MTDAEKAAHYDSLKLLFKGIQESYEKENNKILLYDMTYNEKAEEIEAARNVRGNRSYGLLQRFFER